MKMMGMVSIIVIVVLISLTSIIVFGGDLYRFSGSNQNTFINSYTFLPHKDTIVNFGQNWTCRANITDSEGDQIIFANFTLISPSGYHYINHSNGTHLSGDFWNSTHFVINETGTWKFNITSNDNDTTNISLPYINGSFTITDDLDWTPNKIEAVTNISTDKIYDIEFWTDSRENLNFTINHNIDSNFTTTLNVSHLVINNTRNKFYLNLNISPSLSTDYGNYSYNLTLTRKNPLNRTWEIPIGIEVITNFGDIEFVSPSDYTFVVCPGDSLSHSESVTNNGNYDMTGCHPHLYDTNGTEVASGTDFNLKGGQTKNAFVSYSFSSNITTHFGVYCMASINGSLDYTKNDPMITFIEGEGCDAPGGGGGAAGGIVPKLALKEVKEEVVTFEVVREYIKGDGICDEALGENLWNSPKDCVKKAFDLNEIFCVPFLNCGNWEEAWFINLTVLAVMSFLVYFMVFKKKGRLS